MVSIDRIREILYTILPDDKMIILISKFINGIKMGILLQRYYYKPGTIDLFLGHNRRGDEPHAPLEPFLGPPAFLFEHQIPL